MSDHVLIAGNVRKTYRLGTTSVPVLRGCSLAVRRGEFVAVLGASGSGKSTLLHLLGGLDRPDRNQGGAIEFDGVSVRDLRGRALDAYRARSVGFVFQFYHLLPELTVLENVAVAAMVRHGWAYPRAREAVRDRARALLENFGLGHRLRHRPAELSGGERQRVAIARALINDPPVLLADEPTGNLDQHTGRTILDLLVSHARASNRTMVLVTHDQEVASRADRVVRLVDGQMVNEAAARTVPAQSPPGSDPEGGTPGASELEGEEI